MRLSEDFLLNIKESNDIYDVISSYVPLKKSGTDYVCNCPFHSEKHRPVIYIWPRRAFTASDAERQAML